MSTKILKFDSFANMSQEERDELSGYNKEEAVEETPVDDITLDANIEDAEPAELEAPAEETEEAPAETEIETGEEESEEAPGKPEGEDEGEDEVEAPEASEDDLDLALSIDDLDEE